MSLSPEQITIAVTVYSRREYVKQAIASALNQTMPVRVMVVEDCGPDPTLEVFVKEAFGSRIEYFRNPKRRGIFGNWNACLEQCRTEWLSILHDDDYLAPNFVEAMIAVEEEAPGLDLYFGQTAIVNERGERMPGRQARPMAGRWKKILLTDVIYGSPLSFPGQLFRVSSARSVGGFRASSYYCGEWEMWAKLIARSGAAETSEYLGFFRE
ncbi:MAG: glycosyltransferase family 2 protein, partial [Verrucomicrobiota bacterium]